MTNKLNLKRTPEEALQHRLRKERKRAKRRHSSHGDLKPQAGTSSKRSYNNEQDAGPSRKWASSDEDDEAEYGPQPVNTNSKTHAQKPDYDGLKAEIEQEMFRQKMFDAMGDDERLDSIEAQFNDFAQVPHRWRTIGTGKNRMNVFEEDGYVKMDPRYMDDEEYAEWIRVGMYRKTHAEEYAEQERKKAAKAARREEEKARKEETARLEKTAEEERKRMKLEREARRWDYAREEYGIRWRELLSITEESEKLGFDDIPWPVAAAQRQKLKKRGSGLPRRSITVGELTAEAITAFLLPEFDKEKRKEKLRESFLRFHPDKFEGRFMRFVKEGDKEKSCYIKLLLLAWSLAWSLAGDPPLFSSTFHTLIYISCLTMASIDGQAFFNENSRTLAPEAVGSQVAIMSLVSLVTVVLFNLLRPKNKVIYEPKVKYHEGNKPPPRISDSLFGWLPPLVFTKEPELLDKIGLDAVAFLRFLRLLRWLFTGAAGLACCILIPINIFFNLKFVKSSQRDVLSILTIRDVTGSFLYAHVIVTYLITLLIIYSVNVHWREMVKLRHAWFRSPEYLQSFYARTLQVRHVSKKDQSDGGLKSIFESVRVPYPTTSVHIGRKVGKLPELIDYHNQTVREFEEILVKYLKGGHIKPNRPTIRIGGTCGCGGKRMDAIDFYTAKLKRTEAAIEEYRTQIDTRKAENYGFASMAAVPYAHVVAKIIGGKHPKGTHISLAPNPKDIIWKNMAKTDAELAHKRLLGFIWLSLVCFFNTAPLFVISILANLDSIRAYIPFLQGWFQTSPSSFAVVAGVLPATISGLFSFFLPIIMRWLTKFMGALTRSKLDRAVIARYFSFLIISQLIIFTLIGVIFNSVQQIVIQIGKKASFQEIINNLDGLPAVINRTYIDQASYWLTYFPLRGFLVVFDLAQIVNLLWLSFKTRVFGRTPRDIREWTKPPDFQYAVYYSNILFMGAVGLVFAPLAPLVVVAAAVVFWMSSCVYKYQLMFVFVSKVESGGRIWNVVINRLLFCVLLMQALMILTIGLQFGFRTLLWLSAVPPIFFILAFKIYINRTYLPAFKYFTPTEEEIRVAKVYSIRGDAQNNRLEKRFGHPALHTELFTPMLHKNMMPLLNEVYHGKINNDHAKLDEYGGQKMEAQVVPGGIKIAAIDQNDLMYDPVMYQRDRGELDCDQRSMALTSLDESSKSQYGASSPPLAGYDTYLNRGPTLGQHDIELSRLDTLQEPLLRPTPSMAFQQQQGFISSPSLYYHNNASTVSREAPIHRPQERSYSPTPTYISNETSSPTLPSSQQQYFEPIQHRRQGSGNALASPQFRGQSPAPRPYSPQQQHTRQNSGNPLASSQLRNQTSSPSQPYYPQVSREQSSGPQMHPSQRQPGQSNDFNMTGRGVPRRQ